MWNKEKIAILLSWVTPWTVCILVAFCLLFVVTVLLVRRLRLRKRAREKYRREIEYTLPDRENSFVRERLLTTLRVLENEENETEVDCCYAHAKILLDRITATARATVMEDTDLREIARMIEEYEQKTRLSVLEVRTLNDAFSRLLKTSAKYL